MRSFFGGVFTVLFVQLFFGGIIVFLYWQNMIFSDSGAADITYEKSAITIDKIDVSEAISKNIDADIDYQVEIEGDAVTIDVSEAISKNIDADIDYQVEIEGDAVTMVKSLEERYTFDKKDVELLLFNRLMVNVGQLDGAEGVGAIQKFLFNFYVLNDGDFTNILKYVYQSNLENKDDLLLILKEELGQNRMLELLKNSSPVEIEKELSLLNLDRYVSSDYCFNDYCSHEGGGVRDIYEYVENAIYENKELYSHIYSDFQEYGFSPKMYYAILIIENVRLHTTTKGSFKKFLQYAVPQLTVMTKFSYGLFGTKVDLLHKMANWNYEGSMFYIESELIDYVKENYMSYNARTDRWDMKNESGLIDYMVKNKDVQVRVITDYFRMQQAARKTHIPDFNDAPGILVTLYNIGGFKEPHGSPELGGANFNFLGYNINFGGLGEQLFYSVNMDYLMYRLNAHHLKSKNIGL